MASKGKKPRVKWDSEVERKLIDIWADIIEEFDGKLITRKKEEAIATTRLVGESSTSNSSIADSDTRLQAREKGDPKEYEIHGSHFAFVH